MSVRETAPAPGSDAIGGRGRTRRRVLRRTTVALAVLALAPAVALGAPEPPVPGVGDLAGGGIRDVLPPGTDGRTSLLEAGAFVASGARPAHDGDQLPLFAGLPRAVAAGDPDVTALFKDMSFGVRPEDRERRESPREDVTIVRDRAHGVPRVTGSTRDGVLFGAGWVGAQDRLFLMDVLRHVARAELSGFAGGAPGNRALDAFQWSQAPYTEADLQAQADALPRAYGAEGARILRDLEQYVAGINAYLRELPVRDGGIPVEYAAIGRPLGPTPWRVSDVVAVASLFGTSFGRGGGQELEVAALLRTFSQRYGPDVGRTLWRQMLAFDDPDAPTTVWAGPDATPRGRSCRARGRAVRCAPPQWSPGAGVRTRFPYQGTPRRPGTGGAEVLPDAGSIAPTRTVVSGPDAAGGRAVPSTRPDARRPGAGRGLPGLVGSLPRTMSNALLVSGSATTTGRPIAVFGPQVDFSAPQLLMEQELRGGGIDARGASFAGLNPFVLIGRGVDYAWSATSGQQDITDTFALELCDPRGGTAGLDATGVRYDGSCRPIERLRRTSSWQPNVIDQTPAGTQELVAERTPLGLVAARGRVAGRPTAFVVLRSTYGHEIDSVVGIARLNQPGVVRDAASFRAATSAIAFATNWFYVDDRDAQYTSAGWLPDRAAGTSGQLPATAEHRWRGWDPGTRTSEQLRADEHPHVLNQPYVTNWNNKQAAGFASSADSTYGSVYRSQLLDLRMDQARTSGDRRVSVAEAVRATGLAATTDLRGQKALPLALRLLAGERDPAVRRAAGLLQAWARDGWHRRDADGDGRYEHADAIRIMDAWWPLWVRAQFRPGLGEGLYGALEHFFPLDDPPGGDLGHRGSAYQAGWYGFVQKDLRTLLGSRVREPYAVPFCGGGNRTRCIADLAATLRTAAATPAATVYAEDAECDRGRHAGTDRQRCFDAIVHRPYGLIDQPLVDFQNRPTYQVVADVRGHRPR